MSFKTTLILLPTYNERGNIRTIIPRILGVAPDASILVVDDNSPDGTGTEVETLMKNYPRVRLFSRTRKDGLGRAYLDAFAKALEDEAVETVVMMDADHSHDPAYLIPMLQALQSADVAIGSRYVRRGGMVGWELWRKLLSVFGNYYSRLITGMPVNDTTGGFNMIRTSALRRVALDSLANSGYAFQIELKHLLWKSGARLVEVPIIFHKRREGESKLSRHIISEGIIAPWKMRFKK